MAISRRDEPIIQPFFYYCPWTTVPPYHLLNYMILIILHVWFDALPSKHSLIRTETLTLSTSHHNGLNTMMAFSVTSFVRSKLSHDYVNILYHTSFLHSHVQQLNWSSFFINQHIWPTQKVPSAPCAALCLSIWHIGYKNCNNVKNIWHKKVWHKKVLFISVRLPHWQ